MKSMKVMSDTQKLYILCDLILDYFRLPLGEHHRRIRRELIKKAKEWRGFSKW